MALEDVILAVLASRGVAQVRELRQREVEEIRAIEERYSSSTSHWGRPINTGVLECLRRRHVLAALTKPDFKWPPGPYALLKVGNEIVGEIDERGVRINREALRRARGERAILLLPLRLPELEEIAESCVAASPSPPTHTFLLTLFGSSCGGCGTLLVGFDNLRGELKQKL